jgi:hypothetical protein
MLVFMGPVSLVVGHRQELGLRLLLHWLARERNWVRNHESVSRRAIDCVESSEIYPNLSTSCEGLLYMDHVRYV